MWSCVSEIKKKIRIKISEMTGACVRWSQDPDRPSRWRPSVSLSFFWPKFLIAASTSTSTSTATATAARLEQQCTRISYSLHQKLSGAPDHAAPKPLYCSRRCTKSFYEMSDWADEQTHSRQQRYLDERGLAARGGWKSKSLWRVFSCTQTLPHSLTHGAGTCALRQSCTLL